MVLCKKSAVLGVIIILFLSGCATSWSHRSGNNSNLDNDQRYCSTQARIQAPTYICRNPLMCAPDEFAIAMEALSRNAAVFDRCMMQKGYTAQ